LSVNSEHIVDSLSVNSEHIVDSLSVNSGNKLKQQQPKKLLSISGQQTHKKKLWAAPKFHVVSGLLLQTHNLTQEFSQQRRWVQVQIHVTAIIRARAQHFITPDFIVMFNPW